MSAFGAYAEATASVDLSNLISFNPAVLELALNGILVRLSNLEKAAPPGSNVPPPARDDATDAANRTHVAGQPPPSPKDAGSGAANRSSGAQPSSTQPEADRAPPPSSAKRGSASSGGGSGAFSPADRERIDDKLADLQRQIDRLAQDLAKRPPANTGERPPGPQTESSAVVPPTQAAGSAAAQGTGGADRGAETAANSNDNTTAVAPVFGDLPANLSHRLAKLEDAAEDAKKGLADHAARLAELRDAVDIAHEDVEAMQKKVDGLTGRTEGLESGLSKAEQGLSDAKGSLDAHSEDIAGLRRDVGKLQGRLGTLEGLTTLLNSDRDVGADLKSFSDTLGDLKAAQLAARAELDASKNDLDSVKSGLRDLGQQLVAKEKGRDAQLDDLADKLASLGSNVARAEQGVQAAATKNSLESLEHRLDGVERQAEALARQPQPVAASASAAVATPPPLVTVPSASSLNQNPSGASTGVPSALISSLTGRVDDLSKQVNALQTTLDAFRGESRKETRGLRDHVDGHKSEIAALGNECSKMSADLSKRLLEWRKIEDMKANKQDIDGLKQWVLQQLPRDDSAALQALKDQLLDVVGRQAEQQRGLQELKTAVREAQTAATALQNEKAGKDLVGHLSVDVAELANRLKDLNVSRPTQLQTAKAADEAIQGLQSTINQAVGMAAQDRDWTKAQLLEIRATVEHIHHSKADASLVANKAERDYVENAMEKLMREVEQVLNNTNSGLIDTIDKSLNILRDMIDGKATKDDVNQLKRGIAASAEGADGNGTVPDGLMGYKGFRCLGCNRTMDGMRARPIGSSFSAFLNRVPASPRMPRPPGLVSASPTGGASVTAGHAGYLTAPPGSA